MQRRRRVKQVASFSERLQFFAEDLRAKAAQLRPSPERDALLRSARRANTASHLDDWANSPGLRPPK